MYSAVITNSDSGTSLRLNGNESRWTVLKIEGLAPVPAQINTAVAVGVDGVRFNSARLNARNIVITVRFNDLPSARQEWENALYTKAPVQLTYSTGARTVYIDGYVETFECDIFAVSEIAQISIICPDPYFKKTTSQTVSLVTDADATFVTTSPIWTGITAKATMISAVDSFSLINSATGKRLDIDYNFAIGDIVNIDTRQGHKAATLTRGGNVTNLMGNIRTGSTFFSVRAFATALRYGATNATPPIKEPCTVTATYTELFAGV